MSVSVWVPSKSRSPQNNTMCRLSCPCLGPYRTTAIQEHRLVLSLNLRSGTEGFRHIVLTPVKSSQYQSHLVLLRLLLQCLKHSQNVRVNAEPITTQRSGYRYVNPALVELYCCEQCNTDVTRQSRACDARRQLTHSD